MQNTAEFETLAIDKTAPSTKAIVKKKELDVNIRKISYI